MEEVADANGELSKNDFILHVKVLQDVDHVKIAVTRNLQDIYHIQTDP